METPESEGPKSFLLEGWLWLSKPRGKGGPNGMVARTVRELSLREGG